MQILSFRIFDLTWLYLCKRVIGLVWNIKWMIFSFKFILYKETEPQSWVFGLYFGPQNARFPELQGALPPGHPPDLCPGPAGGRFSSPQTPSWIRKEPAVIAYRAYGTIRSNKEHQEVRARENRTSAFVTTWILPENGVNTWIKGSRGGGPYLWICLKRPYKFSSN